jgi:putative DNA primase/helicase
MYIIGTLPVELDQDAPYGLADEFISSIAAGDAQTERVMCEVIGACMCSSLIVDQAVMLIGRAHGITASNGKSTYINMLRSLLGPGNVSTLDVEMYGKPFFVAGLVGKLANLGDDIPAGYLQGQQASTWKRAVTGDEIKADVKFGDEFDFRPSATQVFSMNVVPRISADDDGLYRRLAFVPFRNHFEPGGEGFDPQLKRKLARSENLRRFAVLGLMHIEETIERARFSTIDDMAQELANVRKSNDVVLRWMDWTGITDRDLDGRWVADVYDEFKKYAEEANENKLSQTTFTRRALAAWPRLKSADSRNRGEGRRGKRFQFKQDELGGVS